MESLKIELFVSSAHQEQHTGWSVVLYSKIGESEYSKHLGGLVTKSSETRTHLLSVLQGLREIKKPAFVYIYYHTPVLATTFKHIERWSMNGWTTLKGQSVKHKDLLQLIWEELNSEKVYAWKASFIKGHTPKMEEAFSCAKQYISHLAHVPQYA